MKLIEVTPANAEQETFFCIKDTKKPGFVDKAAWFEKRHKEGLRIKILKDEEDTVPMSTPKRTGTEAMVD